jgi:lipopolysaccharide/colanic/teichoic acid biosynthesis glycosyltransferase
MAHTLELRPQKRASGRNGGTPPAFDFSSWKQLSPTTQPAPAAAGFDPDACAPNPIERMVALGVLVVASPLLALVALAIKIDTPGGPVFFRQTRVGLNRRKGQPSREEHVSPPPAAVPDRRRTPSEGQIFRMWKFRTMVPNAEAMTGPVWASAHDPRVTRLGQVLRHLRIDEIPQLLNVVQGNMRLIGPRPERPEFVHILIRDMPDYAHRLQVPPGITGLAQVEREYDSNVDDVRRKLGYDLFYIQNRCWLLDFKILLKTLDVVVRGRGAH